jgi:hypothetical protein
VIRRARETSYVDNLADLDPPWGLRGVLHNRACAHTGGPGTRSYPMKSVENSETSSRFRLPLPPARPTFRATSAQPAATRPLHFHPSERPTNPTSVVFPSSQMLVPALPCSRGGGSGRLPSTSGLLGMYLRPRDCVLGVRPSPARGPRTYGDRGVLTGPRPPLLEPDTAGFTAGGRGPQP